MGLREVRDKGTSPATKDPAKGSWAKPSVEMVKGAPAELDAGGCRQLGEECLLTYAGVWAIGHWLYVKAPQ